MGPTTTARSRDHAGVVVPPPLIYVAFLLAGIVLQRYVTLPPLPTVLGGAVAALLVAACLVLNTWSIRRFRAARTSLVPIRPTKALVVEGPYRLTRNPMYVGLLFLYLAVACWFG